MIESPTQVEREVHNVVPSLPILKPFDSSIRLDHLLETGQWHAILLTPSEVAQYNERR
jgi:hypothetical protein